MFSAKRLCLSPKEPEIHKGHHLGAWVHRNTPTHCMRAHTTLWPLLTLADCRACNDIRNLSGQTCFPYPLISHVNLITLTKCFFELRYPLTLVSHNPNATAPPLLATYPLKPRPSRQEVFLKRRHSLIQMQHNRRLNGAPPSIANNTLTKTTNGEFAQHAEAPCRLRLLVD